MHNPNSPDWADPHASADIMSADELGELGTGDVAYVRAIKGRDLKAMFPEVPPLQDNMTLYALLNADGTPILLADSREAAIANAFEQELTMVSVN